jgi:hypothetical protein
MLATKVSFNRLHKFVEADTVFTAAQMANAAYVVLVGSPELGQLSFPVPPPVVNATKPGDPVVVTFAQLGFKPVPGTSYTVQVVCMLDGLESPASTPVTFANSLTPAAPVAVTVS